MQENSKFYLSNLFFNGLHAITTLYNFFFSTDCRMDSGLTRFKKRSSQLFGCLLKDFSGVVLFFVLKKNGFIGVFISKTK